MPFGFPVAASAAGLDKKDVRRNEDKYEPGRCAVCFETHQHQHTDASSSLVSAEDSNSIVTCCKCSVPVHQWCYGVPHSAVATPALAAAWTCRRCEKRALKKADCALCPRKGGALKPTSDARWAHVTCGLWMPECRFLDMVRCRCVL